MGSIGKSFALILIMAISCLIMVESAFAQSIPKPSVPEFTVHLVGPSFTRNTTYSLDSNTGLIVADIGYTNKYSYVILTIENQLFNPSFGSLYYNVQIKNQNTPYKNWTVVTYDNPNPKQTTDTDFTNISLRIEGQWGLHSLAGTQTDIQVQAMLGNFNYENGLFTGGWVFNGATSAWSSTQTISIPANIPLSANSPSPTSSLNPTTEPTSTPTTTNPTGNSISVPLSALIVVVAVFLTIIVALSYLLFRKHRKPLC
jgi:hypothetical protein